ncbi:hypothetical protein F1880_010136 [Penicillium rolfsii]|nr:hypothetical protein F1880_010136 [Penicillium rolfsii]
MAPNGDEETELLTTGPQRQRQFISGDDGDPEACPQGTECDSSQRTQKGQRKRADVVTSTPECGGPRRPISRVHRVRSTNVRSRS